MLELAVVAGLWTWRCLATESLGALWFPVLCAVAAIGLWRRLSWGRFMFSAVSVLLALFITAALVPIPDEYFEGGAAFERMFGAMPPLALCWLMIVVSVTLALAPAVAVGWRKHWFRSVGW